MANGERCRHCGQYETNHEFPDHNTCSLGFESEVNHEPKCPVIGCNGDCSQTILAAKRDADSERARLEKMYPH